MLSNNADARRCSYFELGLPVVSFTPFFAKIAKKIASKCLRVKCNPGHKWIECSENVCTRYRTTLANASRSLFYRAFRKNYAIWLKGLMLEDSLQWIGFVEFSTTNGTVHSDWFFLVIGYLIFPAHISLSRPAHSERLEQAVWMSLQVQ